MSGHIQAAEVYDTTATDRCTIELSTVDALSVGLSLRMLARQRYVSTGTAEIYARVGKQLEAAARRELETLRKARR